MAMNGSPYLAIMDAEEDERIGVAGSSGNTDPARQRYLRQQRQAGPSSRPMQGMSDAGDAANDVQTRHASRSNKALAAICGAVVTSLTMTPFDVIKTRMQTQRAPGPLFQPASSTQGSFAQSSVACCQTPVASEQNVACRYDPRTEASTGSKSASASGIPKRHPAGEMAHRAGQQLAAGASASSRQPHGLPFPTMSMAGGNISAAACIYPDKHLAVHDLERIRSEGRLSGVWDGVVKVGRHEGVRGLWRGLTPTLVMTVPSQVTYMTCYDVLRSAFLAMGEAPATSAQPSLSNVSTHTMAASLAAGALARGASATLVTPLELLRTRLQASDSRNLTSLIKDLAGEIKHESPMALWRGLVPTLYRDVPFSGLYFAGYESLKRILTGSGLGERRVDASDASNSRQGESQQHRDFAVAFISGATSGIFAAIVTHPFDLVKTRLQAVEERRGTRSGAGTSTKMGTALKAIVREEGYRGLFRGLSPRVAKVAPACGIMIASFELVAGWLDKRTA